MIGYDLIHIFFLWQTHSHGKNYKKKKKGNYRSEHSDCGKDRQKLDLYTKSVILSFNNHWLDVAECLQQVMLIAFWRHTKNRGVSFSWPQWSSNLLTLWDGIFSRTPQYLLLLDLLVWGVLKAFFEQNHGNIPGIAKLEFSLVSTTLLQHFATYLILPTLKHS